MNTHGYELNQWLAWLWIALGIVSGMLLGLGFHHEGWLGGVWQPAPAAVSARAHFLLWSPGFVERNRIVASLPSLGLLTLAGLTPSRFEVEYREIADLRQEPGLPDHYDLVAISTFTAQLKEAWAVADHYEALGIPVVMGGIPVSALAAETKAHCSSVVLGEGEPLWPRLLADWERGALQPLYQRFKREGRLIQPEAWELCTLFDINFRPKNMSVAELQSGFLDLARQLYADDETRQRRRWFKQRLREGASFSRKLRRDSPRGGVGDARIPRKSLEKLGQASEVLSRPATASLLSLPTPAYRIEEGGVGGPIRLQLWFEPREVTELERSTEGVLSFRFTTVVERDWLVEGSTDAWVWEPLGKWHSTGGTFRFVDPEAANHPMRLYRLTPMP